MGLTVLIALIAGTRAGRHRRRSGRRPHRRPHRRPPRRVPRPKRPPITASINQQPLFAVSCPPCPISPSPNPNAAASCSPPSSPSLSSPSSSASSISTSRTAPPTSPSPTSPSCRSTPSSTPTPRSSASKTPSEDDLYILATLRVDNRLRVPLTLDDITGAITAPDGAETTTSALQKNDLPNLYAVFPALVPLASAPLVRESIIQPAGRAEGMVLLHYPIPQSEWDQRKSASITLDFYNQAPITVPLPRP